MPRRILRRLLPDSETIRRSRLLRAVGLNLHLADLWHLNRRSVAGATAVGLFCAFIPLPMQMLSAASGAVLFRVNLPVAVAMVWVTNPVTIPPLFFIAYQLGALILMAPPPVAGEELNLTTIGAGLDAVWRPLLLGCFIMGLASALMGYISVIWLWRATVVMRLRRKRQTRSRDS